MGYKIYSDSYLKKLTKKQIISILRSCEHNYITLLKSFDQSTQYFLDCINLKEERGDNK